MQVIRLNLPLDSSYEPTVMGIGYFDGVHLGHQKLLKEVIEKAQRLNLKSSVFTFDNTIHEVLNNRDFSGSITPLDEKVKKFEKLGIDICYIFHFDKQIAILDYQHFISDVLLKLNIRTIVCGSDFRFGHLGKGSVEQLKEILPTITVNLLNIDDMKVSSRNIIKLIKEGNVSVVPQYLGSNYVIKGLVIKGLGNGKKIGFPTANLKTEGYVIPKNGVYKTRVKLDGKIYDALTNIGTHPTISQLDEKMVEVHILNFDSDIYAKALEVEFLGFIREEKRFDSLDDLKKQINLDTFFNF